MQNAFSNALSSLILQHIDLSPTRRETLAWLTFLIMRQGTICLWRLAAHVDTAAGISSVRRRFYRFLQHVALDGFLTEPVIVGLLGLRGKPWIIAMDRTNWEFGKTTINSGSTVPRSQARSPGCRGPQASDLVPIAQAFFWRSDDVSGSIGAPRVTDYFGYVVALGDDCLCLCNGEFASVAVAQNIRFAGSQQAEDAIDESVGDGAEGWLVMMALPGHQPEVDLGQIGIDLASRVGGEHDRIAGDQR
ncbi:hypothetical protein [Aestuariivirga sp.]|jgi:hypothetical protein|uniref:hypothetical protein n=1 Tax=Aestuariivirga sp. TaxID=2650926 RepID=UPI003785091C